MFWLVLWVVLAMVAVVSVIHCELRFRQWEKKMFTEHNEVLIVKRVARRMRYVVPTEVTIMQVVCDEYDRADMDELELPEFDNATFQAIQERIQRGL